jgi:predicted secreted Zn-dependent protease
LIVAAATAATLLFFVPSLHAAPKISTSYSYFPVSGESLSEIHRKLVTSGPTVNGVRGYGVTVASPGKSMSVASCKASGSYKFSVSLNIKLPKVGGSSLSGAELAKWNSFYGFVKRHENQHRAIWTGCAAEFSRRFAAGASDDCGSAHARAMSLWNEMVAYCKPKHQAFDAAQRSALKSHPFMKYASR